MDFAVPRLLINDDAGTAVENLLDAYTQRLTNSETTRTTEDEKHTQLWLDCRGVGKVVHHFNCEALTALFFLMTFGMTRPIFFQLRGYISSPSSFTQDEKTIFTTWK